MKILKKLGYILSVLIWIFWIIIYGGVSLAGVAAGILIYLATREIGISIFFGLAFSVFGIIAIPGLIDLVKGGVITDF